MIGKVLEVVGRFLLKAALMALQERFEKEAKKLATSPAPKVDDAL